MQADSIHSAVLVFGWREKIVQILSLPIESEGGDLPAIGQGQDVDNPENEYYAQALQAQGDGESMSDLTVLRE